MASKTRKAHRKATRKAHRKTGRNTRKQRGGFEGAYKSPFVTNMVRYSQEHPGA